LDRALSAEAWKTFYKVEPLSFNRRASLEQSDRVLGGELVVWGDLVDETNSVSETWPIAAAVAERLWSERGVNDVAEAEQRMFRVRCRMVARGVGASPVKGGEACPFIDRMDGDAAVVVVVDT
jgi:hexosaminidase